MAGLRDKLTFTGYLRRSLPSVPSQASERELPDAPYVLVTTGGGGDGEELIDWVLSAYEFDRTIPHPALLVFGPFMNPERRRDFRSARRVSTASTPSPSMPVSSSWSRLPSAWSRWAATTRSARSCRSASRR